MKHLKSVLAGILAISLLIPMAGCSNTSDTSSSSDSQAEKLITINLCEVTHSVFYAPQYVAITEGFFEDEGLQIELSNGGGADNVMAAVISGDMDIGFAGPEASIYVYNEGSNDSPKVFAQVTQKDGSFLVSKEEITDFSWDDVKGKVIIPGRKGGVPYMTLEYLLKEKGIDPQNDTTLDDSISFDLMAGAFTNGEADFVTLFEPTASTIQNEGLGYIVASIGEEAGEIPYTAYFASQSYMEDNAEIIQKFTNAIAKGQQWVQEHSTEEIAESIQSQFADTDLETLTTALQSYIDIDAWSATPVMTEEAFDKLQDVIIEAGELTEKVEFEAIVDNSYAKAAIK